MGLAGAAAAVAPGTPHLPIHRSLSYCAPCLHPPHTTIRPLTSLPPQHLINWAHLWGKGGKICIGKFWVCRRGRFTPLPAGCICGEGGFSWLSLP